jgi:hypothetical protein
MSNLVISYMIKCLAANKWVLNTDKTNIMKFITKNSSHSMWHTGYKEKNIEETLNTQFLGLQIDNHLHWKKHNEEINPKLNGACYTIRSMVHISNINILKSVYYAYFHSIIKYEIIFGGNYSNSGKIFTVQKKIIRFMADAPPRSLLKQLQIPHVPNQYILSWMNVIINNHKNYHTNSPIQNINTRNKHNLHRPNANLYCFQKSTFYVDKNFQQFTMRSDNP